MDNKSILRKILWYQNKFGLMDFNIVILSTLNMLNVILNISVAFLGKNLIDNLVNKRNLNDGNVITIYLSIILISTVLDLLCYKITERYKIVKTHDQQRNALKLIFELDYFEKNENHTSEFQNYLFSDIPNIVSNAISSVPQLFGIVFGIVLGMYYLVKIDPIIFYALMIGIMFFGVSVSYIKYQSRKHHNEIIKSSIKLKSFVQDSLNNFIPINIFKKEDIIISKLLIFQNIHSELVGKRIKYRTVASGIMSAFYQFANVLILVYGSYKISLGHFSLGTLTLLIQLLNQVQGPVTEFGGVQSAIWNAILSIERIEVNLNKSSNKFDYNEDVISFKSIQVNNLNYSYDSKEVYELVNFSIDYGDKILITGNSGSGKSTLMLQLMGFLEGSNVEILCEDGKLVNFKSIPLNLISYVPQNVTIFEGSVYENISMFDDSVDFETIRNCANLAKADNFINQLPQMYDTPLAENGRNLSKGQIQRLGIARSLCKDSPIIILDEATSALDSVTETQLISNLVNTDKTVILISHNSGIIKNFNKHLHIKEGSIIHVEH